jgi:hypothetical protein
METYGRAAPKCNVLLHMLAVNSSEKCPEHATFLAGVPGAPEGGEDEGYYAPMT